jgi:hypothetical protein
MELNLFSPICLNLTLNICAEENLDALRIVNVEFSEKKQSSGSRRSTSISSTFPSKHAEKVFIAFHPRPSEIPKATSLTTNNSRYKQRFCDVETNIYD